MGFIDQTGADFACPKGTPIYAPIDGQIRWRNYGSALGNHQFAISPDPGQPFAAGEVHFSHTTDRPPDGKYVKAGDLLAHVGAEGNVVGAAPWHLHFEYHPTTKNSWSCSTHANPQPVLDWQPATPVPPPGTDWLFPAGKQIFAKYLKVNGHEINPDGVSDSIKGLQEVLKKHGYQDQLITGKYWTQTDTNVRADQTVHIPPPDPEMQSYVGPKQWRHLSDATGCPYTYVVDTAPTPPEPTPIPPPVVEGKPLAPSVLLPGAVWAPVPKTGGGWFTGLRSFTGSALKITCHTTETSQLPNWQAQQSGIPHLTVDLRNDQRWQHLSFDMAAYTMQGGEHSPNSDSGRNIQIEIIGYTRECGGWSAIEYARLRNILEWLCQTYQIPYAFPLDFAAPVRQSWPDWERISGILGHVHATYNNHTDPTGLRTDKLIAGPEPIPEPPEPVQPLPEPEPPEPEEPPVSSDYVTKAEYDADLRAVRDALLAVSVLLDGLSDTLDPDSKG